VLSDLCCLNDLVRAATHSSLVPLRQAVGLAGARIIMKSNLCVAISLFVLSQACQVSVAMADRMDSYQIGAHGQAHLKYPAWFKKSFLDLREDLNEAREQGKRGIIVFFSQTNCNHCQAFISTTLDDAAVKQRVQKSYDIVGLDIFSDLELADIDGSTSTIRDFAEKQKARLTPTLLFYSVENKRLLRILGFYPPEKFNRVLDYLEGGHFQRVSLRDYLRTTSSSNKQKQKQQDLNYDYALFAKPPHQLQRNKSKRPLMVLFETPNCNPCERFHKRVLANKEVQGSLQYVLEKAYIKHQQILRWRKENAQNKARNKI